ncbi:phospholipid-transporting ATPase ABCA3 isoform X2 [Anthonomus grandis grandis]|uniref:phospholipid-transporting ATPase ABCA3 isoform X2 n=1 Tax=Anthonomus grandis grandis TaxID=2921223 RepID=UPI0021661001|nr:phospholipid-transporting ATPase ABCA3 isoform X2 [Anthonomus grandis grandis]
MKRSKRFVARSRNRTMTEPHNKMAENWNKFLLLMWKNWRLQWRRPIKTLMEILVPIIFFAILVLLRSEVSPTRNAAVTYDPICTFPIPGFCQNPSTTTTTTTSRYQRLLGSDFNTSSLANYTLMYSPSNNTAIDQIMNLIHTYIHINTTSHPTASLMEAAYVSKGSSNTTFAAVQFEDHLRDGTDFGSDPRVKVTLRFPGELRVAGSLEADWKTTLVYPIFQTAGPRNSNSSTGAPPNYYQEGFLALQQALSAMITARQSGESFPGPITMPVINMRRFPYASWNEDLLAAVLQAFFGTIIMFSFIYPCMNIVSAITYEKEKQLKETMKIMGLPNWLHWLAWFLKSFILLMISVVLMVVLLKVKWYHDSDYAVLTYADPFVLLLFMMCYLCATITFCFAISVFFSKADSASNFACIAWFISSVPYLFVQQNYDTLSLGSKVAASLFGPNTAVAFGFQVIFMYEGTAEGVQFDNIWKPNTPDDNLSLGIMMMVLLFDSGIFLLIALYVEAVYPGEFGVPQKWYFPFTTEFWCGRSKGYSSIDTLEESVGHTSGQFEEEPTNLQAGVKIQNLRKVFESKVAVDGISLNMYEDQITVLLGHNGAGKTTTMSMLTGMFPPSSGTAVIGGYDIRTDIKRVRENLGLCPQHNVIFDELTVEEHLYFFSKLKGVRGKAVKAEVDKYVELLELKKKRMKKARTLSGGMKRKLCVGIALCGGSKVVMLDEPTSGMDPSARRALWDLLLSQKTGRTILLTTHFMDEADLLGDRIAIMAAGEVKCCGSSFFLKKKYGVGYRLIIEKTPQCNPQNVTDLLGKYIPRIQVESNIGSELSYLLAEGQSNIFEPMLKELEAKSKQLGVGGYGISLATLEEVFMKYGCAFLQETGYLTIGFRVGADHLTEEKPSNGVVHAVPQTTTVVSSSEFLKNQIIAMSLKKILSAVRKWFLLVLHMILPAFFIIVIILIARQNNRTRDLPAMKLDLSRYSESVLLVDGADLSDSSRKYAQNYREVVGSAYKEVPSIHEHIMDLTAKTPSTVKRRYLGGISFSAVNRTGSNIPSMINVDANFTAYFNNDPYHTPAVSLGLAMNTVHRIRTNCSDCGIDFVNHPMPFMAATKIKALLSGANLGYQVGFNLAFSMACVGCYFLLFVVKERTTNSKHLQFVSGIKVYIFWLTTFLWDFIVYVPTVILMLLVLLCFQEDGFKSASDIGRLFVILIYFGWCMLPFMYIAGFFFKVPASGYGIMAIICLFTGDIAMMVVEMLRSPGLDLEYVGDILHWIFLLFPHYSLGAGVRDTYKLFFYNKLCDSFYEQCMLMNSSFTKQDCLDMDTSGLNTYCVGLDQDYFKWEDPGIGANLVYSFTTGFLFIVGLLIFEYGVFSKVIYSVGQRWAKGPVVPPDEDSDVRKEREKILNTPEEQLCNEYKMMVKNLTKHYKNLLAVNGLCLGVKDKECFGLLGINGAGKTTTFKMLTGDVRITHGDAWLQGHSVKKNVTQVQKLIGYCPQFDALLDDLTALETLIIFSLIRGIPRHSCTPLAKRLASEFDFERHLLKQVRQLSGGNKRKLSASIAMIGDPPVVFMDEPTTGMDPATKRYFWNTICHARDSGKTIILTSHSMEECEALCTRLAIMVNGNFKCLGSAQHLKNKFADGYTITIKMKQGDEGTIERVNEFMTSSLPGVVLKEKHDELLTYFMAGREAPLSKMFGILEQGKRRDLDIEDYSLGQSNLEQVFLRFTRDQHVT